MFFADEKDRMFGKALIWFLIIKPEASDKSFASVGIFAMQRWGEVARIRRALISRVILLCPGYLSTQLIILNAVNNIFRLPAWKN